MKNILVISSSPRRHGNSSILCDEFINGAEEAGNKTEKIYLADLKIYPCKGCGVCSTTGKCVQKDDMKDLLAKMAAADAIVLATPVYFYCMCGQLKIFIDRTLPCYSDLKNKEFYFILTSADGKKEMLSKAVDSLRAFTEDCLDNAVEKAVVYGLGVWKEGEIRNKNAMLEAYEAGRKA